MNELRLDQNHDIYLNGGSLARFSSSASDSRRLTVGQSVLCLLKTEEGEAFTNIEHGVPWFGEILDLPVSHLDLATKILREKIAQVEGVKEVLSVKLKMAGRRLSGIVRVRTSSGETVEGSF